jgi:ABC-type nitrate/sulfonate/bicarbonate transport system substrate-binding protein
VITQTNRLATLSIGCIAVLTSMLFGCNGRRSHAPPTNTLPKVTVGIQTSPAMALVMVAKDQRFFEHEGVDVQFQEFTAGKFALQAFLGGSLDFAIPGEVPVCLSTLQGNKFRVITQVVEKTENEVRVVARRDASHTDPASYFKSEKRKLAMSFGGGPEFFTYSFLNHYGIAQDEVELLSMKPEDMPAALQSKSVDAISIFDPFAYIAEERMGEQSVTFANSELYSEFFVLIARQSQIDKDPTIVASIVRGLVKAADFVTEHPESAKSIVQRYTKLDQDIVDGIWPNFIFRPALTKELRTTWDAEVEWAKVTKKVDAEVKTPDWDKLVEPKFLKQVKSDAVTF